MSGDKGLNLLGRGQMVLTTPHPPRRYTGKIELLNVPLLSPKDFSAIPMD